MSEELLEQTTSDIQTETPASEEIQPQGQEEITQEEITDWTKDKRYGSMWHSENDLYKSYRQIEPEWQKSREVLKQHGLKDFDGLTEKLKAIQEYENPENPKNLLYSKLEEIASHEKYGGMLIEAFQNIQQQQLRDKWGESMPPEVIQKLEELDGYKSMFERQEQERALNAEVETLQTSLTSSFENVYKLAQEHQIDVDMQEFINHCQENKVIPEYVEAEFLKQSLPNILKAKEIKAAESVQKNIQDNAKAGLSTSTKAQPQTATKTVDTQLEGFFKKFNIN